MCVSDGLSLRSNQQPVPGQRSTSKKTADLDKVYLEPAIWSRDTGQRIPCFDKCQLTITLMSNIKDVCCKLVSVKWSIASWMSSKLEPVIWLRVLVTLAYMKGRTDVRTYVRTLYVRTEVDDVMAIKPNFHTSMGYHIFLTMVLRARAPSARAELRYYSHSKSSW